MGTVIVGLILLAVVGAVIASMVKAKKAGKSVGCGCGCANCPSASACGEQTPPESGASAE